MTVYLGIDCGGTHIRTGLVDDEGQIIQFDKRHSPLRTHPEDLGQLVLDIARKLTAESSLRLEDIKSVGIGVPGPIDFTLGQILVSSNLSNSQPIHFVQQIEEMIKKPVFFDRDTNIALLGEKWKGEAQSAQNTILLTLGTGVGGAILINGQIYRGQNGLGGEIGHIYLETMNLPPRDFKLPICGLGHAGCFEGFIKSAKAQELPFYLGQAMASIVDIFNPEQIILGGGMMHQIQDSLDQAKLIMRQKAMHPAAEQVKIVASKLGDQAGVLGGAHLAKHSISTLH